MKAAQINPQNYESLFNIANIYFDQKEYTKAIEFYKKVIHINTEFV